MATKEGVGINIAEDLPILKQEQTNEIIASFRRLNEVAPSDLGELLLRERKRRKSYASINSAIIKEFSELKDPNDRLRIVVDWCRDKNLGVELRAQDWLGLGKQAFFEVSQATLNEIRKVPIGFHFSDWERCWELWQDDFVPPRKGMTREDMRRYYGGETKDVILNTLVLQAKLAENLGAKYGVIHATWIDYTDVLTGEFSTSNEIVLPLIARGLSEIIINLREAGFKGTILLENEAAHGLGIRSPEEANNLFRLLEKELEDLNRAYFMENLGICWDTSHRCGVILRQLIKARKEERTGILLEDFLKIDSRFRRKVLIHASETSRKPKLEYIEESKVPVDFWERRKSSFEYLVDNHLPYSTLIKKPHEFFDKVEKITPHYIGQTLEMKAPDGLFSTQEIMYDIQTARMIPEISEKF